MVERGNRALEDSLRVLLFSKGMDQDNWNSLLPRIMKLFRAIPDSRTEETSNFLMFGKECCLSDQLVPGSHYMPSSTLLSYALELATRLGTVSNRLRSQ